VVYVGVLAGAAAGLVLGLLLPKLSAALQTAIAGALLIYTGAMGLARWQFGDGTSILPDSARGALVAIGLITVLGVVIQWTVFQRRADK
jgi:putative flippase GtrA